MKIKKQAKQGKHGISYCIGVLKLLGNINKGASPAYHAFHLQKVVTK